MSERDTHVHQHVGLSSDSPGAIHVAGVPGTDVPPDCHCLGFLDSLQWQFCALEVTLRNITSWSAALAFDVLDDPALEKRLVNAGTDYLLLTALICATCLMPSIIYLTSP